MLVIRPAMRADVRVLVPLLAAHILEHQARHPDTYPRLTPTTAAVRYGAEWLRRLELDPTCHVWLAADRDIRGMLAGEVWSRPVGEPTPVFFAEWLYVIPEYRGAGLARALWRTCVAYCEAHGISTVEGVVMASDTQWHRRGWRVVSTRVVRPVTALAADVAERPDEREEAPHADPR
jgi:GNAT superfamily N-acetyltransferase